MFAGGDVCQLSLEALEGATGLSRTIAGRCSAPLVAAGVIAKEEATHGRYASRYRLLLTAGGDA